MLRTPSPAAPGKGVIYWNLWGDIPLRWVDSFTPLGEGALLSLHQDPVVLLQAGPAEMYSTWNGTYHQRGEKVRSWSGIPHPSPIHLLTPDSATFPTSTTGSSSKCCSCINIQGSGHSCSSYRRGRPLHISPCYVSVLLTLVFCCSCGFQSWDGHLMEIPFYSGPTWCLANQSIRLLGMWAATCTRFQLWSSQEHRGGWARSCPHLVPKSHL